MGAGSISGDATAGFVEIVLTANATVAKNYVWLPRGYNFRLTPFTANDIFVNINQSGGDLALRKVAMTPGYTDLLQGTAVLGQLFMTRGYWTHPFPHSQIEPGLTISWTGRFSDNVNGATYQFAVWGYLFSSEALKEGGMGVHD